MSQCRHSGEQNQIAQLLKHSEVVSSIFKLLTSAQGTASTSDPNQIFEILNFQLGDEILDHSSTASNHALSPSQDGGYLLDRSIDRSIDQSLDQPLDRSPSDGYIVCQGRVRLLCQTAYHPREVTARVVEVDGCFGAEPGLGYAILPYRAVAASPVQLVRISAAALTSLLQQHPPLQERLHQQAQLCERLIFFKTLTLLHALPSHQLAQLVAHLVEHNIPAGEHLTQTASAETGHFWLRQGEIKSLQDSARSFNLGESWGYPQATPSDWIAATELQVYRLPVEAWETFAAWMPATTTALEANGASSTSVSSPRSPAESRPAHRLAYLPHPTPSLAPEPSQPLQTQAEPIAFPKPIRRRWLDFWHRYPWIEQQSSSDCGAACLAMISRYWGKKFPIHALREQANVGRSGASLKSLAKAAETLGFHAQPVRASLNRLAEQKRPWIAHWEGMHFVVVYQIKGNLVLIADPALGHRRLTRQEFQTHWTNYALLLEPTEQLQATDIKQGSLTRYLNALVPYRSLVLQVILFSVLIQAFGLVTPLFTQIILDKVVVHKSLTMLNVFALGLLLFGVWSIGLTALRQYLLSYFSNRLDLTLISGFIHHTLMLPLRFFESRRVGDIITRVQENQKIQRFLIGQVILAWLNFVTGFVYLGLMFYYNWRLTLLVLILIPPIALLTLGATPFLRRVSREIFKEAADQNSVLVEMMTGIATIKAAAAERELRWRWEDHLTSQMNVQFRGQKLGIGLQAASGLINSLGSTALLWYGATLVIQNQLTIGQFVAFNMMIGYVISPVLALANLWDELQEVFISVERLNDVFEAKPEETAQQPGLVIPPLQGAVTFENVTFRYGEEDEQNTLQNITFEVKTGQTIAIVGRSGSGKSTLVKLLEGLYHPNRGRVMIDGHDIRHVSPSSLRSQMGVVPQDCFLFSGTISENIALYRPEFTLEQVIEAAKLAEAHAFIQSLPLGYNTKVGERGSSLSGGQRQRIAIARALLADPRILILDEATSSLDTESERRFQQNLMQIRRDRTTFIIAHRLSTVRNADNILVLDRGVIVEQGDHKDLMTQQGLYYHLAQQQLDL